MILKKNFKQDTSKIDLEAEIDSTLSFEENYNIIIDKFIKPKHVEID